MKQSFSFLSGLMFAGALALGGCAADVGGVNTDQGTQSDALRGGCRWDCPRCRPGEMCPMIACRLVCPPNVVPCGNTVCRHGQECCNASCGICTEPGGLCTQEFCGGPVADPTPAPTGCTTDADCRTFADYCTGCDCRALATTDPDPVCSGPGVRCFADPCVNITAACDTTSHTCVLR